MKIRYSRKRLRQYLIFGSLWFILGIAALVYNAENVFSYGYLLAGILYFVIYLFENTKQYLTIRQGIITKKHLIPKKINIKDIIHLKKFDGKYILKTIATEMKINMELIEEKSLVKLKAVLENLNVELK
ncbi:hypothetical protein FKX85_17300 [Echinicola soli]|uniref:Uncharacterized protein n=1 Tax=Echinicola soli TaxID=2591634 RepID=A0A514CLK3_9BACT|nr:hypothetical protein [Echinicola soli]QDH80701.1 hypothetical protein FKX85_17300 [Echinicola soli]